VQLDWNIERFEEKLYRPEGIYRVLASMPESSTLPFVVRFLAAAIRPGPPRGLASDLLLRLL